MTNVFNNIFTTDFKNVFNDAIDSLLEQNGLTLPCKLIYSNTNPILCNNCIFDPISNRSLNKYNGTGPSFFGDLSICPVCNGFGFDSSNKEELIHLAVLFDSKSWLNWNSKSNTIRVPDGMIQTICKSDLLPKIRNADKILIDTNKENYGSYYYIRSNDPEFAGFGDTRYIFTMWQRA
ncbi:MAG: hypothetical protein WD512_18705 [Candidatus Paceibacterota bacterium]